MTESFWTIPDTRDLRTPVTIIREQAEALTQQTNGLLQGEVLIVPERSPTGVGLTRTRASLKIAVPYLNDYAVYVLSYTHNIDMYPGDLTNYFEDEENISISNEDEFINALKKILSSSTTLRILGNLLSQANAAA